MYKLEHHGAAHTSLLLSTVQSWASPHTDVFIVSREGHKIFTNRYNITAWRDTSDSLQVLAELLLLLAEIASRW